MAVEVGLVGLVAVTSKVATRHQPSQAHLLHRCEDNWRENCIYLSDEANTDLKVKKVESKFVRKRVQSNVYKKEESFSFLFIKKNIYIYFLERVNLLNQFAQIAPLFKSNND